MSNPVGWFEIYVDDMERARAFYEAVFGVALMRHQRPELDMSFFPMEAAAGGAPGALVCMPGVRAGGNSVLVYFSCADCGATAAAAAKAGGRLEKDKTSIGEHGHIALVLDTEGNMIGLHSP